MQGFIYGPTQLYSADLALSFYMFCSQKGPGTICTILAFLNMITSETTGCVTFPRGKPGPYRSLHSVQHLSHVLQLSRPLCYIFRISSNILTCVKSFFFFFQLIHLVSDFCDIFPIHFSLLRNSIFTQYALFFKEIVVS